MPLYYNNFNSTQRKLLYSTILPCILSFHIFLIVVKQDELEEVAIVANAKENVVQQPQNGNVIKSKHGTGLDPPEFIENVSL